MSTARMTTMSSGTELELLPVFEPVVGAAVAAADGAGPDDAPADVEALGAGDGCAVASVSTV